MTSCNIHLDIFVQDLDWPAAVLDTVKASSAMNLLQHPKLQLEPLKVLHRSSAIPSMPTLRVSVYAAEWGEGCQ